MSKRAKVKKCVEGKSKTVKRASFRRVRISEKGVKDRGKSEVYRVSVKFGRSRK